MTAAAMPKLTVFADPYKKCEQCQGWIDGAFDVPGPLLLSPCEHRSGYRDVCPSWGPVDGCRCAEYNVTHQQDPIVHDIRVPGPGDERTY